MGKYLSSADIAAICDVDLKTIHNWADQPSQQMPSFRTPGRHLRFKPRLIVPWLQRKGYDVNAAVLERARLDALEHPDLDEAATDAAASAS